jgi:hypothetical protein
MTKKEMHTVSDKYNEREDKVLSAAVAPLSPHRAFVVHFRVGTPAALGHFAGRVEHMTSGNAARFHSREELCAFIEHVLIEMEGQES